MLDSPPCPAADPALDAASAAAATTLLNCYLREGGEWREDGSGVAVFPLPGGRGDVRARISHRSATFHHRFEAPEQQGRPLPVATLAGLLAGALADDDPRVLLARVRDSLDAVAGHLAARAGDIERLWSARPLGFVETEQALLLGHPLHPAPKGVAELGTAYLPERRARFALHWLSVAPDRVVHDSATGTPAPVLAARLRGAALRGGRVVVPAHPWEAAYLRDAAASLFERGDVVDLGPDGARVTPTSSVRTVYREDWPWQLKFSLHAHITNSLRVTLPKELERAVEAARLARTPVGAAAARIAPRLVILHDPAYLAVRGDDGIVDGFSVLLRANRWPARSPADVSAPAVLCQDHPYGGRSRLAAIVGRLAETSGRAVADVAREWFARYCEAVIVSLVRLYLELGLCFEPHQQNTLLELERGWPARCVVRDSQGYFHRQAAHADLCAVIPGLGEASESIFPEALADERLVYYPFVNNALSVIDALGAGGCIEETVLLADLRAVLERERARGGRYPATLLDRLLDDERWPCKANLRTRLHDMDELTGDIATQSVYVTLPEPAAVIALAPIDPDRDLALVHGWMNQPHVAPWWGLAGPVGPVREYLSTQAALPHLQPWIARAGDVPFAYVETYRAAEDPLAAHYDALADDRGWHILVGAPSFIGSGVPRALGRDVLARLLAEGRRVVCEPDVRNARMLAYCRALGGEVRAELELPGKRAALVVWER